ncbi:dihydropteroate synthase [Uliginosibacterium sp. 31-12]|uniref:dihydropteroate synthase n=1 Tax=Uliginosibacterium sp. 31-12 TaxID=3062781 RepID=UPI0026E21EE8|nr:dihydropteroate synthase [Uliginosibacterium sp. 31-12]MDO6387726.1 dihydropteroate synthase [Uliginosibacterium sp. 31-12]
MAIINLTPDSFSGDGLNGSVDAAMRRAEQALNEGATILDIGGESTRPGSKAITVQEELARVIPAVRALTALNVPISVDTTKPEVMAEAIAAGASIINDINALRAPGALEVAAASTVGVCLMHMQGQPRDMQQAPRYADVNRADHDFLAQRLADLIAAGIESERISLDPGFGFGKTLEHNLELFRDLPLLAAWRLPVLVGVSRKTMLGEITGQPVESRLVATAVSSVLAAQRGASILRVHDVAATRDALVMWHALDS